MVKRRVTAKGWGIVFVCMTTSAVHLELTESYSTDSFLMAFRRFLAARGTPARIVSDRGSQLVDAAKEVGSWDFTEIQRWAEKKKMVWDLVPAGAPWMNGVAERMVGLVKNALQSTFMDQSCTYAELNTALAEAAVIVNSRPIGIHVTRASDVEIGGALTPMHLMLGRATVEIPVVKTVDMKLSARLLFVQDLKRAFWNKWFHVVSQGQDRQHKWRTDQRDMRVGDVVLLKDESAISRSFRLARIARTIRSTDNLVRKF